MKFFGVDIVYNHADYRLMSRRVLHELAQYGEVNLFLRGLVPLVGFPSGVVEYERRERFAGTSKYPLKKMLSFALDGVTSFSIKPIRFITGLGLLIFVVSVLMLLYFLIVHWTGHTVSGVDLHHGLRLGHRRPAAVGHRRHRRIHRQDLSGNQAPPPLHRKAVSALK